MLSSFEHVHPLYFQQIVFSVLCYLALRYVYCRLSRKLHNYPPGPIGIPVIGSALSIDADSMKYYNNLIKRYDTDNAGMVMLYVCSTPWVFIYDYQLYKKALSVQLHRDVPADYETTPFPAEQNETDWHRRRKLNHKCLFSLVNSEFIHKIVTTLAHKTLFQSLDQIAKQNSNYYCRNDIYWLVFAVGFSTLFGAEIEEIPCKDDVNFETFRNTVIDDVMDFTSVPLLKELPRPIKNFVQKCKQTNRWEIIYSIVRKWYGISFQNKRKVNDSYLQRMLKLVDNQSISFEQALVDGAAMISASLHTTSTIIELILCYFARYASIQENVYQELKQHGLKGSTFCVSKLHLFRAFIYESIRYGNVVKITLSRDMEQEFILNGYKIPKNATIVGLTGHIHFNKKFWKHPQQFHIHHFLDENEHFKPNKHFKLFGHGKRDCFGQQMALNEIFSILSSLLYRYKFSMLNTAEISDRLLLTHNIPENQLKIMKRVC